jgi:hypothetical protein
MKPRNFPDRVNQRRMGALNRLNPMTTSGFDQMVATLMSRIRPDARAVRTKINRSSRGPRK